MHPRCIEDTLKICPLRPQCFCTCVLGHIDVYSTDVLCKTRWSYDSNYSSSHNVLSVVQIICWGSLDQSVLAADVCECAIWTNLTNHWINKCNITRLPFKNPNIFRVVQWGEIEKKLFLKATANSKSFVTSCKFSIENVDTYFSSCW